MALTSASALTTSAGRAAAFTTGRNYGRCPSLFPQYFLQQPSGYHSSFAEAFPISRIPSKEAMNVHGGVHMKAAASSSLASSSCLSLELPTAQDTEEVGALLSALIFDEYHSNHTCHSNKHEKINGLTILLGGDLGAGKTAFARGFIRAATGDESLIVTSPTYLLVNVYQALVGEPGEQEKLQRSQQHRRRLIEIHHMDLYRLSGKPDDLLPLNLDHIFANCISLIEWPERIGDKLVAKDRLDITIVVESGETDTDENICREEADDGDDEKVRIMILTAQGELWERCLATIVDEGYLDDLLL